MAERDLWVGRCHVKARYPEARQWSAAVDEAVLVAVVTASDAATGQALVAQRLEEAGLDLLTFEHVQTLLQRFREQGMSKPLVDLADRTSTASPVAFGEMLPILLEPEAAPAPQEAAPPPAPTYAEIGWDDLFGATQPPLWAVIDGVNCREVMARLAETDVQSACLYASTDADTRAMAPWLVRLEPDSELVSWLKGLPQDQHWGILLQSTATLKQLRTHLRKFTMLWTPANDQAPVYFRFYDPRVALDMSQALAWWKLTALMAPMESLVMSLSPSMTLPADLEPMPAIGLDTGADEVQGRLLRVTANADTPVGNAPGRQFVIGDKEYRRFGELAQARSRQALARSLAEPYPQSSEDRRRRVAEEAVQLGQRYRLSSTRQIETLARCVMEVGADFPQRYPEAGQILDNPCTAGWRKRELLAAWLPRGRVRHALMNAADDAASLDNYRPITDEERS
ncbi:DUF4123 domain-containing protein [Halomonas organivorans]|uniref:DUF4123 domain-containing protein n=3 Tax=Halomonas organivorans TaxID=257772 RepID=A0A7W5G7K1_9GAMM|nr:DUF4123 domain-containing protein [Halomonas organivorans]MBB3142581.1 hypothetical protein [Halomonas organivorans]